MKFDFRLLYPLMFAGAAISAAGASAAQTAKAPTTPPESILPPAFGTPVPAPALPGAGQTPVAPPVEVVQPPPHWTMADATSLLAAIKSIGEQGLDPADYKSNALTAAMTAGEGDVLDLLANEVMDMLVSDMRDGRTPAKARVQWLVKDSDSTGNPTVKVVAGALATHDIVGAIRALEPQFAEYAALKAALKGTAATNVAQRKLIRVNLERWRWLPRSVGPKYLMANVPEYQLRLMTFGRMLKSYRVIVGKNDTATPQLVADATGIVVHPPWYLPRSIITQEVGPLIARSPAAAKARGYSWTGSGKTLSVVQQPGPSSALGFMKIDLPNPDAIFIHDTPNRTLFDRNPRAFSHGCLRTERALELGILLGALQGGGTADELAELIKAGKTQKVPFKEAMPVVIGYFTYGPNLDGKLQSYIDIYGRDAPVIASLDAPRVVKPAMTPVPTVPSAPKLPLGEVISKL
jgi:L,D-transpeptidase YcbB